MAFGLGVNLLEYETQVLHPFLVVPFWEFREPKDAQDFANSREYLLHLGGFPFPHIGTPNRVFLQQTETDYRVMTPEHVLAERNSWLIYVLKRAEVDAPKGAMINSIVVEGPRTMAVPSLDGGSPEERDWFVTWSNKVGQPFDYCLRDYYPDMMFAIKGGYGVFYSMISPTEADILFVRYEILDSQVSSDHVLRLQLVRGIQGTDIKDRGKWSNLIDRAARGYHAVYAASL